MRRLIICLLLSIPLSIVAEGYAVLLCSNTGKTVLFTIGDEPTAYIENTDIVVRSNETELRYPISEGISFKIIKQESTDTKRISTDHAQFHIKNGIIMCKGLRAGEAISLYSINGTKLNTTTANENGESIIDTKTFNCNTIIVKTKNKNFKIIKK